MNGSDLTINKSFNESNKTKRYRHLLVQCENCYRLNHNYLTKIESIF